MKITQSYELSNPIKILDKIEDRYYIIRMDKETFELYGLDEDHTTAYQETMESLNDAYQSSEYTPQEALAELKS